MDKDEVAVQLHESLGKVEPHPLDHEAIVARAGKRRRRRIGTAGAALSLLAAAVAAVAILGGPSEGPLGPPTVEASARVALPGEVVGAGDQVVGAAAAEGDYLWVLTCSRRCGGPPSNFEHSQDTLVKVDSGSGAIVARTPVEGAGVVAVGEGGVWTAGYDGTVTHYDPQTGKALSSVHLLLPKPVCTDCSETEALAFLPNGIVVGEGAVWVSTAREYIAQIDPRTTEVVRMLPTPGGVYGMALAGGSLSYSVGLFGVGRIDAATGDREPPRPIADAEGRELQLDYLAVADGSLWARGAWGPPRGTHKYVPHPGGDLSLARLDPQTGRVEQMVSFNNYIWVHAVSGPHLWLASRDSRAGSRNVYAVSAGSGKVELAARLAESGTIVGAVGTSLWVARPGDVLERYDVPIG